MKLNTDKNIQKILINLKKIKIKFGNLKYKF